MSARLEPIEEPDRLKIRFGHWMTRQKSGKVLTPVKAVTARMPESLEVNRNLQEFHEGNSEIQLERNERTPVKNDQE